MILFAPEVVPPVPEEELDDDDEELPLTLLDEDEDPPVPEELDDDVEPEELALLDDELDVLEELEVLEVLPELEDEPVSSAVVEEPDVPVLFESTTPKLLPGCVFDVICEFAATCLPRSISDTF